MSSNKSPDQQRAERDNKVVTKDDPPLTIGEEKRAAASSRGFAGLPAKMEEVVQSNAASSPFMQEKIDFVKTHFQYCWKDVLTREHFDWNTYFEDPISLFPNFPGYWANITFLRNFLAPIYELHDVRQDPNNPNDILVRWTFSMQFWWNRYNPLKVVWDPRLAFTGITILGVNPETGKFNKHIDKWDSADKNRFFSLDAFLFVQRQMWSLSKPPNLPTPEFVLLKKYKDHEIRKYRPFTVAEADMGDAGESPEATATSPNAFRTLAKFLEGDNDRNERNSMTTPVFTDGRGHMQFYLGERYQDARRAPQPSNKDVRISQFPGGLYGTVIFSGNAAPSKVREKERWLRERLQKDGQRPAPDFVLARYNTPWTLPPFKRNEVLIPIDEKAFQLW